MLVRGNKYITIITSLIESERKAETKVIQHVNITTSNIIKIGFKNNNTPKLSKFFKKVLTLD
jgi:hypothetical protein